MTFLLDTNAVSEIRSGRDPNVRAWAGAVDDLDLHLSVLTLGEIRIGIDRLRDANPAQADVFSRWLSELRSRFIDRILQIDSRVADEWGRLDAARSRNTVDSLIAATARVHELTVVTRNTKDFEDCDIQVLNPWEH